jgi:uncharacterized protein YukE
MSDIRVSPDAIHAASTTFSNSPAEIASVHGALQRAATQAQDGFTNACMAPGAGSFGELWSAWSAALGRTQENLQATAVLLGLDAKAYAATECVNLNAWNHSAPAPGPVYGPYAPPPHESQIPDPRTPSAGPAPSAGPGHR